jgi:hypothetical protein
VKEGVGVPFVVEQATLKRVGVGDGYWFVDDQHFSIAAGGMGDRWLITHRELLAFVESVGVWVDCHSREPSTIEPLAEFSKGVVDVAVV